MAISPCQSCPDTFLSLLDTPDSYSGQAGKFVRVNSSASGLEFFDITSLISTGSLLVFPNLSAMLSYDASSESRKLAFVQDIKAFFGLYNKYNSTTINDFYGISFYDASNTKIFSRLDTLIIYISPVDGNDIYTGLTPSEAKQNSIYLSHILTNVKDKTIIIVLLNGNYTYDFSLININTDKDVIIKLKDSNITIANLSITSKSDVIFDAELSSNSTFYLQNVSIKANSLFLNNSLATWHLLNTSNIFCDYVFIDGKVAVYDFSYNRFKNNTLFVFNNKSVDVIASNTSNTLISKAKTNYLTEEILLNEVVADLAGPIPVNRTNINMYNIDLLLGGEKELVSVLNNKKYKLVSSTDEELQRLIGKYGDDKWFVIKLYSLDADFLTKIDITNYAFKISFDRVELLNSINLPIVVYYGIPYYKLAPNEAIAFKFDTSNTIFKKLSINGFFEDYAPGSHSLNITSDAYNSTVTPDTSGNINFKDVFFYTEADFNNISSFLIITNQSNTLNFYIHSLSFEVGYDY